MLSFSDATLRSESATTGVLSLKNTGLESACQFEVLLQGFPVDCMQVDPVPLLYPGAQEDVRVQLFHRKLYPAAGAQELVVMVSSPTSYPGEQVVIRQGIYVAPVLEHSVKIFDDMAREEPIEAEQIAEAPVTVPVQASVPMMAEQVPSPIGEEIEPLTPVSVPAVQTLPVSNAPVESVSPPSIVVSRPAPPQDITPENSRPIEPKTPPKVPVQASPPPPPPQQQASEEKAQEEAVQTPSTENDVKSTSQAAPKPRVVRSPSDDFWDEE